MTEKLTFSRPSCRRSEIEAVRINADRAARMPDKTLALDAGTIQRLTAAAELAHRHSDLLAAVIPALEQMTESVETQGKRLVGYEKRIARGDAERNRMIELVKGLVAADRRGSLSLIAPIFPTIAGWARDLFRVERDEDKLDGFTTSSEKGQSGPSAEDWRRARVEELQKLSGDE